jgi:hypothetical protein
MSETKRPLKVFLYHAPGDRNQVRDLYLRLLKDGVDAWLVKEKLLPGQEWKHEIHNSVREADAVIVCLSRRFDQGDSRHREVRAAFDSAIDQLDGKIFLLPVHLEECDRPENLGKWQWVGLFAGAGYEMLIRALQARADEIGAMIQRKESSLPHITTSSVDLEQPIPEERAVEATQAVLEVGEGAGILIEGSQRRTPLHRPERVILAALLGFIALMLMILFGPAWIETSYQIALTAGLETPQPSASGTQKSPLVNSLLKAIPTLIGTGDVSHIVFLIDTSGSMQGRRIRMVKSAVSEFISRLGDQYLVSVIEFDTNVELRMGVTADHTAAIEAVQSIVVGAEQDAICLRDALFAGIQQTSLTPVAEDAKNMMVILTDTGANDTGVGSNCNIHFTEDIMELEAKYPVSIFDIHVGDNVNDILLSRLVTKLDLDPNMEGVSFAANDEGEIDRALVSISEAARLYLNTQLTISPTSAQPMSMVFVPPGEFIMGNNAVTLDAFWIDKTEITNAMYARCVQTGQCSAPGSDFSRTRSSYYGNPEFDHYPVIFVSWMDANHYCTWTGGRLPTEAEWEKAARGTDGRQYPWGNNDPLGFDGLLNYQAQDTTQVGIFPNGASPYGALDMAGNVSEWVADWLSPDYYSNPPASNPLGPDSGQYRVWRGGSWANTSPERVHTYSRTGNLPTDTSSGIGFRCARDAAP